MRAWRLPLVLGVVALLIGSECVDQEPTGQAFDAEDIVSFVQQNLNDSDVLFDAISNILAAVQGAQIDGITLIPNGNLVNGTIELDFDNDGTAETTVVGVATFADATLSFDDPVTMQITQVMHPTVSGSASTTVTSIGTDALLFESVTGSFSGSLATLSLLDGGITVEPSANFVEGWMEVAVIGGGVNLPLDVTFQDNGVGGWEMVVVGEGVNFTVP